ncbi:MAG TPA: Smr/MutS family protein [Terriglobia bacterium]|nr:Smr/MutS family protein [Terriglobia bacterium]
MAADALRLLEFAELLALLEPYAGSPLGRAQLLALAPGQEMEAIRRRQTLAAEAAEYLRLQRSGGADAAGLQPVSFTGFDDPTGLLVKLGVEGTTLELAELSSLLRFAEGVLEIRRVLLASRRHAPALAGLAGGLGDFQPLLRQWRGKILPNGELDDHASPGLYRVRREMERQRGLILSSLRSLMRTLAEETPSQEEIITVRGDRFVVPVRVGRRSQLKGVVHGSSSSGQTVYVEPLETIELNNDLVRLREQEQREIFRILSEMTASLRQCLSELTASAEIIGALDLAFACGKFAREYDCVIPRLHPGGAARLRLVKARHPLLESLLRGKGRNVVPVSLELESGARILVISGPNTGGKTVAMKTVGLLALMALAGLPVPAEEAEFPLFDRVLADIGDAQSIQESLSTFSAHLVNIASMLNAATPESLILLDELGSATDPEEAGALAVAVVERFRSIGAYTIASTHHMALKAYAANTPGVLSANMGFHEETLAPTYQLEIGRPGRSSGIAIAERLGLPHEVVERARQSLSSSHLEVERFLARLKADAEAASQMRAELAARLEAQEKREREWHEAQQKRELERTRRWEQQLETLLQQIEQQAGEKLRELGSQALRSLRPQEVARKAAQVRVQLKQEAQEGLRQSMLEHLAGGDVGTARKAVMPAVAPRQAGVGDTVRLKSLGKTGVVRNKTGDTLEVEVGLLRTRVSVEDVEDVLPAARPAAGPQPAGVAARVPPGIRVSLAPVAHGSLSEINVIGETAEEALRRVDKFLDNAYLASLSRVRVVHGSGKGVLRKSLAEMFATHPHVEKFFPAPPNEGGAGATIVELKQ